MKLGKSRRLGLIIALVCLSGQPAIASDAAFCAQLVTFSKNLEKSATREVTLYTEWSEEWVKACKRDSADQTAIAFCQWLVEHTSTEFMELNVRMALSCLNGNKARSRFLEQVVTMTGTFRFYEVALRGVRDRVFELEYSVRSKDHPDMLRIAVERSNK